MGNKNRNGTQVNSALDDNLHKELHDRFPDMNTAQILRYVVAISLGRNETDAMKIAMRHRGQRTNAERAERNGES
jgi:hypothetical protein